MSTIALADGDTEAQTLLAHHKWAEAAIVLRTSLRRNRRSVSSNADLARALFYLGRREDALNVLNAAIDLNHGKRREWLVEQERVISRIFRTNADFQNYQDGVDLLAVGNFHAARDKFERARTSEPDNVEVLTRLGQAYLLDGDRDSAAERLKLAHRLNPYEPEIQLWLGRALYLRGELKRARKQLQAARARLKQSELAPVWLADVLVSQKQVSEAIRVLEEDVKVNPIHVLSLIELAKYKTISADGSQNVLWSARKDYQYALSRLSDYVQPGRKSFESELGVDLPRSGQELREKINSRLQKLESLLEVDSSR